MGLSYEAGKLQCLGFMREATLCEDYSSLRITMPAALVTQSGTSCAVQAFVDAGLVGNFIHSSLIAKHHLLVTRLEKPLSIASINKEVLLGTI